VDRYRWDEPDRPIEIGPTVDHLVDVLIEHPQYAATSMTGITVSGFAGKQLGWHEVRPPRSLPCSLLAALGGTAARANLQRELLESAAATTSSRVVLGPKEHRRTPDARVPSPVCHVARLLETAMRACRLLTPTIEITVARIARRRCCRDPPTCHGQRQR
jgi:hypothetical protein